MPRVEYATVIDGEADQAWEVVKQFGELHRWHPAIAESAIEDDQPDGLVGIIRRVKLQNGEVLRERLLSLDDPNRTLSYNFDETQLPLDNYVGTIRLTPLSGQARTFVQWSSRFDLCEPECTQEFQDLFRDVFVTGLAGLERFLRTEAIN